MKINFVCDSCGVIMKMNDKEWIKHLQEYHLSKVNYKKMNIKGRVIYEN